MVFVSSVKLTQSTLIGILPLLYGLFKTVVLDWLQAGSSALPVVISNEMVSDWALSSGKAVKRTRQKSIGTVKHPNRQLQLCYLKCGLILALVPLSISVCRRLELRLQRFGCL